LVGDTVGGTATDCRVDRRSPRSARRFNFAKAIADSADGGVIEECGHWVFEEKILFIRQQLSISWEKHR
jgi:hypothetical protein